MSWLKRAVVAAGMLLSGGASAGGADLERARTYFEAGAKAYDAGQYLAAVQAFEEAHRLAPERSGLVFSIAQAYRRQYLLDRQPEHLRAALAQYRGYLAADPNGNRRGEAVEALGELELAATRLGLGPEAGAEGETAPPPLERKTHIAVSTVPKSARVEVDGKPVPAGKPITEVTPGTHRIVVKADGYFDKAQEVPVPEGAMAALQVELRERPALVDLRADEGAQIYVDGRAVGLTPLGAPLELSAGGHFVAVSLNGREGFAEELRLARGEKRKLDVELSPTVQRVSSYVFFGVGGAAAIAGGVLAGIAAVQQKTAKDIQAEVAEGNIAAPRLEEYNDALDARDRARAVAGVALGGALLAGLTGLFLFTFDQPALAPPPRAEGPGGEEPREEPAGAPATMEVSVAPWWLPEGGGASLGLRF